MNLLTTAVLLASAFEVLVPVGGYRTAPEKLRCEFDSVKKLDSERIVFVAGVMMRDAAKRAEIAERIRLNVRDAKQEGFRETAAWFWSFWCSDARGFTTLTASDGWKSDHICCPLDPGFRQVAGDMVRDFARTGVDMLLLDDDYRYGIYHDEELVCTCARHMALVEKNLGERIAPAELKKKAMTGGRNRWRDAWMDANGAAFRDYAAFLRKCVDEVNPKIRLGLCACMSHWDNDGVDAATTARILAGGTRPFLRLIAAPYWASPDGPQYYGCNLQSVIEFSRMERTWVTGDDIEVVSEGDTYPRPRWTCGSSHLELFDLALRVDGRFDGILKYAVDYDDPTRDGGYVARHVRNRPLYREVARRFDGKKAVGVRIYEEMNRLREAVLNGDLAGNTKIFSIFGSPAAKCCGDLAIPTVWEGEGLVGMAFGENVRHVPAEARRRGLVIDAWAARILMAQGVDVGVKEWGAKVQTGVDVVADGLVNSYAAYEGYDVTLAAGAEVIGPRAAGRPPYAFLYRNAAGEKYLVLPLEAYWTKSGWHRTYEAGRFLAEGIRRLAGRPLPAFLPGNPDVLLMAKDGADGSRSVAVFNCFSDALVDAPIELDRAFDRVEFVNCRGRLEGSRVILDEVPAYDFAALTVFPPAQPPAAAGAPSETIALSADGEATLSLYLPPSRAAAAPAVVICPGGGYRELCDTYEGVDMAKWLTARGIVAGVLRYRLSPKWRGDAMLEDIRAALACVRRRAKDGRIDPGRVGVLGFSAGGHLACLAGTVREGERPDFMALVYPHVSLRRGVGNEHMREAFLGPGYREADVERYSGECRVSPSTPRTFLVHARTDEICTVEHSRRFAAAMREKGCPVDFVELPTGRHGLGCGKGPDWQTWLSAFDAWLGKEKLTACAPGGTSADWVDPFVGTDTVGHTYPAACVPFGMVQAGPDTGTMEWKYCSGYQYADTNVLGFSQTHLNGTGCPDLGDVQVFPFSGALRSLPMQSGFRKANEKAKPGFYATYLDADAVGVEIAAEKRGALYRFRYDRGAAKILFNLPFAIAEPWTQAETSDAWIEARGPRRLVGSLTRKGWIPSRRVSFAVAFDRAWTKFERLAETEKGVPRYVLSFDDLKAGETVQMKIALSMTDVAAAERNLAAMCPGFDIAAVRAAAEADWNRVLARLTCEGSEAEKRNFYTAVYHLFQQPNDYSDVGASARLTTLSIWDTFRAAQPLYTIVAPEIAEGTVRACLAHGRENGELPVMSYGGKALSCMIGNHAVPMIVDLFLKREADFPRTFWEEAYRQIKNTLTEPHVGKIKEGWEMYDRYGYYPCDLVYGESVSRTLECGYDDWCAAQMAKRLGHDADAAFFLARAARWRNVFDPELKLMRGKDSRGRWREPFDPYAMGHGADTENDFTEGNAFQYTWHVLQDPQGLIAAFGSPATFVERLDAIFADQARIAGEGLTVDISGMIGQYVHGNEPSHHVPYLYTLAGRPDRTAEVVREVFDRFYFPRPDGLCGNDDCGQMSAWYLFSAMGFYPVNPCGGDYVIGAPQVPAAEMKVGGEGEQRTFRILAKNLSKKNKYVKSVRLNGRPLTGGVLRHADILAGGELLFEMTDTCE